MRQDARLLRRALGVRADGRSCSSDDEDGRVVEAFTPDFYLPEQDLYLEITVMKQSLVTRKNRKLRKLRRALPGHPDQALLQARHRAPGASDTSLEPRRHVDARRARRRRGATSPREEIPARVASSAPRSPRDYEGREPLLVALAEGERRLPRRPLPRDADPPRASTSSSSPGYAPARPGGTRAIRLLKDLDVAIEGRDVLIVEDVVDTGLTLNYLCRTLALRDPASLAAVTLLDRPYRRLVDDLPVRYVGFTVPDEFFVGYGFDLDERYRHLPRPAPRP